MKKAIKNTAKSYARFGQLAYPLEWDVLLGSALALSANKRFDSKIRNSVCPWQAFPEKLILSDLTQKYYSRF
jgi:hypothetical protein